MQRGWTGFGRNAGSTIPEQNRFWSGLASCSGILRGIGCRRCCYLGQPVWARLASFNDFSGNTTLTLTKYAALPDCPWWDPVYDLTAIDTGCRVVTRSGSPFGGGK